MEALDDSIMPGATGPVGHSYFGLDSPFQGYETPAGTEGKSRQCTPRDLGIVSHLATGEGSSGLTLAKADIGSPVAGGENPSAASAGAGSGAGKVTFS